ncbi:MAG: sigma-E factor negative regulatory protein [Gammaproteobacteria bacterium]
MNEAHKEQISALMDGEASDEERALLVKRLSRDSGSMNVWADYHRISDVMHGGVEATAHADFARSVMAALEGVNPEPADKSAPTDEQPANARAGRGWGAMAVAASAGALAFALVFQLAREPQPLSAQQLAVQTAQPQVSTAPGQVTGQALIATPAVATLGTGGAGRDLPDVMPVGLQSGFATSEPARRLSAYMVEHNQHAVFTGGRGAMPYARIAGAAAIYDR